MKLYFYFIRIVLLSAISLTSINPQARFSGLGDLPGGKYESYAYGVSGDGKVVVGSAVDENCPQAVKWVYNSELKTLTIVPLGTLNGQVHGEARGVSYNGTIIAGTNANSQGIYSFKWMASLGYDYFIPQPENSFLENKVYGISSDGGTVIGDIKGDNGYLHPFKYSSGILEILELPSICQEGHARSVSADGSVIVGSAIAYGAYISDPFRALAWGPSGLIELSRANQGAGAYGVSSDGKIAVGYSRMDTDYEAMAWQTDGSGYRYLFFTIPYAASSNGSVIVGWTGDQAYVYDKSHDSRSIQDILVKDYGLTTELAGWKLTNATGVSADGSVIVGTGINPDGNAEGWWAYIPFVSLYGPYSGQSLLAQTKDTLRWDYGGVDINSFNIYLSLDSGKTKTLVVGNYNASTKEYVWEIPDVMEQYCKLYMVCTSDPSVKAESPIFQIKGYRMHRVAYPSGKWELFNPAKHGWSINNSDPNMWPQTWWKNFNYDNSKGGIDPFTNQLYPFDETFGLAESKNFIDWPLFVRTIGVANCYWSDPLLGFYNSVATEFWRTHKDKTYEGACYGFTYSTLLAFGEPFNFKNSFPEMPDFNDPNSANNYILSSIPLDDNVRKVINSLYFYQYGKLQNDLFKLKVGFTSPRQLLDELKTMFLLGAGGIRGLSLLPDNAEGGHEVVPYRLSENPVGSHKYRLYVNDSNHPLAVNTYIEIDSVTNNWSYSYLKNKSGRDWSGQKGLTLDPSINFYFSRPAMSKHSSLSNKNDLFMASNTSYDFYLPQEVSVIIKDNQGRRLGTLDTCIINEIPDAAPMKSPSANSSPIGYSVPKGSYKIETSNFKDSLIYFTVFTDSLIYSYTRFNADSTQKDDLAFGYKGINFKNNESVIKKISFSTVIPRPDNYYSLERKAQIDLLSQPGDSLSFYIKELSDIILTNFGTKSRNYDLRLRSLRYVNWEQKFYDEQFVHKQITINPNSAHWLHPNWNNMNNNDLEIYIDNGNKGSYDSSFTVSNQFTDVKEKNLNNLPESYELSQNYPNPFNNTTIIRYSVPKEGLVTLKIYNVIGQELATLVNETKQAGNYEVTFNSDNLTSGVYLYKLISGGFTATKKMILLK